MSTDLLIQILLAAVLLCWGVGAHNRLVRLKNAVGKEFVHIDTQLRLRQDLLGRLLEQQDRLEPAALAELAEAVRAVRSALEQARLQPSGEAQAQALQQADQRLDAPLAMLWQSPQTQETVRNDPLLRQTVLDLAQLDSRLEVLAEPYNLAVASFNAAVQEFPAWLIARLASLKPLPGLQLGQHLAAREAVRPLLVGRRGHDAPAEGQTL